MKWALVLVVTLGALDFDARLKPLIPDDTWHGEAGEPPHTMGEHVAALKADPDVDNAYFVTDVVGKPDAKRVIFLIPQFHRSPLLPIAWSSLGEAIAAVQGNIDFTLTRLILAHGVRCVGTEGTWLPRMLRSTELDQVASWLFDLRRLREAVPAEAGVTTEMEQIETLLTPALKRHAMMLDGPGIALARMRMEHPDVEILRFGLEDEKLNTRALELLHRIRPIEEELALLEPDVEDEAEDGLSGIWRDEWPRFKTDVALPLQAALKTLQAKRTALLHDGEEDLAQPVGKFSALASSVTDEVLKLDEAFSYERYYEELRTTKSAPKTSRPPTRKQRQRAKALHRTLGTLQGEYDRVANRERERAAVRRTLANLGAAPEGSCALVMGANHAEGLVDAVKSLGGSDVAVVVLTPFPQE